MQRLRFFLKAFTVVLILVVALPVHTLAAKPDADVVRFIAAKRQQMEQTAEQLGCKLPLEVGKMFDAAASANWRSVSNLFGIIITKYKPSEQDDNATNRLPTGVWYPLHEVGGFCEMFTFYEPKFVRLFADEIFKTVPTGSVFFGGTDPGRFIITALSSSHREGQPFFTITQNQLVARDYLAYVQAMYGKQLKVPGTNALRLAFDEYLADAGRRLKHDQDLPNEPKQIRSGEDVQTVNGRVQVSGQTAVMTVNGLVAKALVNGNPEREFYVEESFVLDWMYPHLSPAGPVFKLNHAPLDTLTQEILLKDRDYWARLTQRLIGFNVQDETAIADVCTVAEELAGRPKKFQGDPAFLRDQSARNMFAKLRSSASGLYAWRMSHAQSSSERRRMVKEAELAFKQAYLLSPKNPESVWRFMMFLIEQDRAQEAQKFVAAAVKLNPGNSYIGGLVDYVQSVIDWKKRGR